MCVFVYDFVHAQPGIDELIVIFFNVFWICVGMPDDCTVVAMHVVGQAALLE